MEDLKIRVLHVVGSMNQGGVENLLMNLYRNIDKQKIQFDFLVNRPGIFDNEIKSLGGKVYYIPALQKVGQIKYTKNLDCFFYEHKEYNIIHSHLNQVSGLILERAKKAGIQIRIAHSHNNKYGKNYIVRLYKNYLKVKIKNNANYYFACSTEAGKFLYGNKIKFELINNAIDVSKFSYNEDIRNKVRKNLKIDKGCFVIGSVARICYQKNPIFLLNIFREFNELDNNSKLLWIGNGPLKNKVIKYIKKYKLLDKVIILENRKDVYELMQAMDFFVFPSRFEGLPLTLIEAQSAGLRCITSEGAVSQEAKISDLLKYYSLNKNAKQWAKEIYINKNYERKNMLNQIKEKKYDIKQTVKYIEEMYIKLSENEKERK